MIVLDAYAVLAILNSEPAGVEARRLVEAEEVTALTVLGMAEVLDVLVRIAGADQDEALLDLAQLGLAESPPLNPAVASRAGLLRARHYHRRDRVIGLADCVAAETARSLDAAVATADPHLLDICASEGIPVTVLPDRQGRVWRG